MFTYLLLLLFTLHCVYLCKRARELGCSRLYIFCWFALYFFYIHCVCVSAFFFLAHLYRPWICFFLHLGSATNVTRIALHVLILIQIGFFFLLYSMFSTTTARIYFACKCATLPWLAVPILPGDVMSTWYELILYVTKKGRGSSANND